jgi:pyrophosphate--fructose-6-phosphate 1-phosphotransferase
VDTELAKEGQRAVQMLEKMSLEQADLKSLVMSMKSNLGDSAKTGPKIPRKVALLTAGGLAPCLSAACGGLIQRYNDLYPEIKIIAYKGGYKGLLLGDSVEIGKDTRSCAGDFFGFGGSPIGNSRVKLTNVKDCVKRGMVKEGQDPQKCAAEQLVKDGVDVLHTIGGDDTNLAAADLAAYLKGNDYDLIVIGLPKTIDNDVYPIKQTLGAWTAAEEGAKFFANVVNEQSASHRMLIVHEVMGRDCGYLTAATARHYRESLKARSTVPHLGLHFEKLDVHAVYIPEVTIDIEAEAKRLSAVMDNCETCNIFVSEGAGVEAIVKEMEARGQELPRDAFGHVKLADVNPGAWFASRFAELVKAERVMVQKSGYFSRAAPANQSDLDLIKSCCAMAVDCAVHGKGGVIGHDEDHGLILRAIEFDRIKGGKPFDVNLGWFREMMAEIKAPARLAQPKQTYNLVSYVPKMFPGAQLPKKVAILTAGGIAPCLCASVGGLIERYNELYPNVDIICYTNGYRGVLKGQSFQVSVEARRDVSTLYLHGGSPLGSSRVRLSNAADCVRKALIKEGEDPYATAAKQLKADGVDVLHPIGGDTVGAELAKYLQAQGHELRVIGLPKTIDNDVTPIKQTLGAYTAAEQGARYFANVVAESTANPRMLIIHEVMGVTCGYLCAATAEIYRTMVTSRSFLDGIGLPRSRFDVHAVFIPELPVNIQAEADRLKTIMTSNDCVNIFLSEGAGIKDIADELEKKGQTLPKDEFGKIKTDEVKPGEYFAKQFAAMIGAEKVLVQKSGYYARSSAANADDLRLIKSCTDHAVECAIRGENGRT